jgi:succinate dehydrogenase / fumarate reductase cytochrome b subunit
MNIVTRIFCSSVGKKFVMAATGLVLFGFVIGHLIGNLQVFLGPEAINKYGHFLQSNLELVWPARIVLLTCVLLHIWSAVRLTAENRAARPVPYGNYNPTAASYASRTMMMSGLIVAAFIIYHLLHYTAMVESVNLAHKNFAAKPEFYDDQGRHDIFKMMVVGFSQVPVSVFYIIAIGLLSMHLSHGVKAAFSSLGWKKKSYSGILNGFAVAISIFIFLGYSSIPIAILLGFGKAVK